MKLAVKIIPGAKVSEVVGWEHDPRSGAVLKLRIAAPPVDGKANKEIVRFLAKLAKVPKSSVELLHGSSSKIKLLNVPDGLKTVLPECQD